VLPDDHPVAFEAADAAQARRRREAYAVGELGVRHPAVAAQLLDDGAVDAIHAWIMP